MVGAAYVGKNNTTYIILCW